MEQDIFCQWQYNQAKRRLVVLLPGKNIVTTTLTDKHLAQHNLGVKSCSLADFDDYNVFHQLLQACGFEPQTAEILSYSAVAIQHFLLPTQPKSWFFDSYGTQQINAKSLAKVHIKQTNQWAAVLVSHIDENVANCLWLETELNIAGLTLQFGEPLRIFIDRLQPININFSQQYYQQSA